MAIEVQEPKSSCETLKDGASDMDIDASQGWRGTHSQKDGSGRSCKDHA